MFASVFLLALASTASAIDKDRLPVIRTTPRNAGPGGDAAATIVSWRSEVKAFRRHWEDGIQTHYGKMCACRTAAQFLRCFHSLKCNVATQDYEEVQWDAQLESDLRQLVRLAIQEDLDSGYDWTTVAVVDADATGSALVVSREKGVVAGIKIASVVIEEMQAALQWEPRCKDGDAIAPGTVLGKLQGNVRALLTAERIILNLLGRLCGIASLTAKFVAAIKGTNARVYDTRKTTPGWRRIEKFAVRAGGGCNHRIGLYDAVLIKDNHLAYLPKSLLGDQPAVVVAMQRAREIKPQFVETMQRDNMIIELEVDTLDQLQTVLPLNPDIVLLDNMTLADLSAAVALRNELAAEVQLEASGGIRLDTIAAVAATGVDRISCGALTHGVTSLDIGLDWDVE
jgi:nicotinate-nucleotide pyrophosphorylase (carboxylating)